MFQKILKADIRVNFEVLQRLMDLVIKDRLSQVDKCWICAKHGGDAFKCKKDNDCLRRIVRSVEEGCRCSQRSLCDGCDRFMKEYELTCALQCAYVIELRGRLVRN